MCMECIVVIVSMRLCASSIMTTFPFNLIPTASRVAEWSRIL